MSRRKTVILLAAVAVALLVSTNIPLMYGWLHHVPGRKFMGVIAGVRDTNFYFMMMEQADSWRLLLQNKFAAGEPNTIYHGFFWALLGKGAHILNLKNLVTYHAARIIIILLFVPVVWFFVTRFLETTAERIAALLMICFGGGIGWIQMIGYYRTGTMSFAPSDIATPEATSFFTLMTFPHIALALALLALCFALFFDAISQEKKIFALLAGACGLVLGFIHAVNLAVIFAVLAVYAAICFVRFTQTRAIRMAALFALISLWPIVYYLYLALSDPLLLPQAPVRSPGLAAYLAGFAPFLILGLPYVISRMKTKSINGADLFLCSWVLVNTAMLYSYPLISQEARAVLGLQLPLAVLASAGLFQVVLPALGLGPKAPNRQKALAGLIVAAVVVTFTFPSTFCNIIERVSRLKKYPEAFSLTDDEYDALQFLRRISGEGTVLSGDAIGNYLPGFSGKYSWLGQYDLPSHDTRSDLAKSFFAGAMPPAESEHFLRDNGIAFIFYGREERAPGRLDPEAAPYLERLFRNRTISIYRVKEPLSVKTYEK